MTVWEAMIAEGLRSTKDDCVGINDCIRDGEHQEDDCVKSNGCKRSGEHQEDDCVGSNDCRRSGEHQEDFCVGVNDCIRDGEHQEDAVWEAMIAEGLRSTMFHKLNCVFS